VNLLRILLYPHPPIAPFLVSHTVRESVGRARKAPAGTVGRFGRQGGGFDRDFRHLVAREERRVDLKAFQRAGQPELDDAPVLCICERLIL